MNSLWRDDGFATTTDRSLLDLFVIHRFISEESYWGIGRSRDAMAEVIERSALCFGLFQEGPEGLRQIGFARVVGDNVVFGLIADVFVLSAYRGRDWEGN